MIAGALSLATTGVTAAAVPAVSHADTKGTAPTATIARVGVDKQRLEVRAGQRAYVIGTAQPAVAGLHARLQVLRGKRWRTIDKDRTSATGRYVLGDRVRRPMSARVRVLIRSADTRLARRVGRLNAYRYAHASWYGPGLYGNHLGCGGRLGTETVGVAHKTLPCGTKITLHHKGRTVRTKVIDRGPYVGGRYYDLTAATKQKLGFGSTGTVWSTR
jgi:rare lipoprotein A (peptidoglycan hydrolase)